VTYSRPIQATGKAPEERFGHTPIRGGVPQRCLLVEIASFVAGSSRSNATVMFYKSYISISFLLLHIQAMNITKPKNTHPALPSLTSLEAAMFQRYKNKNK
jgi:hypothetical protein